MALPGRMKAARFYEVNQPLRIEKLQVPKIKDDEVLVQVRAVGLCGSDVHIVFEGVTSTAYLPITLGHESSGIVVQAGEKVQRWSPGTRVSISSMLICGQYNNCLSGRSEICYHRKVLGVHQDGALADYVVVPAKNLIRLPDNIPYTVGAIITDAVATPFHALIDRAALRAGESVAIYGAGGLGLHAVQIAKIGRRKTNFRYRYSRGAIITGSEAGCRCCD